MKPTKFQQVVNDFVPSQENLVSTQEVIKYFKEKGLPLALRTLTKYSTMGLIHRPFHIGNKGYFEKEYIYIQCEAIYILKAVLQCSLAKIKKLAEHNTATLGQIVENLHKLTRSMQYELGEEQGVRTIGSFLANSPKARKIVDAYLKSVSDGSDPEIVSENLRGHFLKSLNGQG